MTDQNRIPGFAAFTKRLYERAAQLRKLGAEFPPQHPAYQMFTARAEALEDVADIAQEFGKF